MEKKIYVPFYIASLTSQLIIVGNQGTESSQNSVHMGPDLEMSTEFDMRPWKRLPDIETISKNVDL